MECKFNVLAENEHGYVGQCACCEEFNFAYKNLLITFSEEHLMSFFDWVLTNQDNPEFQYPLRHGRMHVYQSPVENLFVTFNEEELEDLQQLSTEVKLVLEARKIINRN